MSDRGREAIDAMTALHVALERTAEALAYPRLDTLLETEAGLAAALAILPVGVGDLGADRARVVGELVKVRAGLSRCRRLGGSLSGVLRLALGSQGALGDYGPDGRPSGHALPPRVGALEARG